MTSLRTDRLRLRPFRRADLDAYAAICADEEVMRHIGAGGAVGPDIAWRQMAMFLGEWQLNGHGMWAVERLADARLIGRVGFLDPVGWPACELGWLLARDTWGQGYAQEAARAALACGREAFGIDEPISLIRPGNARSIALAERLGAVHERNIEFMGGPTTVFRHRQSPRAR